MGWWRWPVAAAFLAIASMAMELLPARAAAYGVPSIGTAMPAQHMQGAPFYRALPASYDSGPLAPLVPLRLSARVVSAGEGLTARITLRNASLLSVHVRHIVVGARPPGGTRDKGPFADFGRIDNRIIRPGDTFTVRMTRVFSTSDRPGRWFVFVLYQIDDGEWYGVSPNVYFMVTPGIVVTRGLHLSATHVSRGGSLTASITLRNGSNHPITLATIDIAARPPGGSKAKGPFDDFGIVSHVTLAPGKSIRVTKSRAFTRSDRAGLWSVFAAAQTLDGKWEALSPDIHFTLTNTA